MRELALVLSLSKDEVVIPWIPAFAGMSGGERFDLNSSRSRQRPLTIVHLRFILTGALSPVRTAACRHRIMALKSTLTALAAAAALGSLVLVGAPEKAEAHGYYGYGYGAPVFGFSFGYPAYGYYAY